MKLIREKNLWKFQGDGSGNGFWSTSVPANGEKFNEIVRTYAASYASCNGIAYYLSGLIADWITDDDRYGKLEPGIQVATPGLLTCTWILSCFYLLTEFCSCKHRSCASL